MQFTRAHMVNHLKQVGLVATKQRVALLDVLHKDSKPCSVESLLQKTKYPMNIATAYRTLNQLVSHGLVTRVSLGTDRMFFEMVTNHHHHLTCRVCGLVEDVDVCIPPSLFVKIQKTTSHFSQIERHELEFFSICRACMRL